jgi:hypothetical protein
VVRKYIDLHISPTGPIIRDALTYAPSSLDRCDVRFIETVSIQHRHCANRAIAAALHGFGQAIELNSTCKQRFHRGNNMKKVIALALVVGAVALGACRREEAAPEPMKLGGAPAAEQTAR